jgi:murein DD-endopeptidase MepM/ murein hydrolase activator NlpD
MLIAIAAVPIVLVVVLTASTGGAPQRGGDPPQKRRDVPTAVAVHVPAPPPPKHQPRVVVAVAPGDLPPDAQFVYGEAPEARTFHRPSDAEVKRELKQLRVAKASGSGAYVNPLAQVRGLTPERIDMGVDYQGAGPILALGSGTVFNTAGPGWPGGAFVGITLDSGPYAGLSYFVAEDVKPAVHVGDHVTAGQVVALMYRGPAGIETGWAAGHGDQPLAAALGQQNTNGDPGAWSSAAGVSFDRVLVAAGAPSGIPQGTSVHGHMAAEYP